MHRHRDAAEAFFVLAGEYLMFLGHEQRSCPAGSFVYVPRGTPHTFKVASSEPGKRLNLFVPAAMVGFFEELAVVESAGTADAGLLDEIAERNQMEVLGPVPETYLSFACRAHPGTWGKRCGSSRRLHGRPLLCAAPTRCADPP